MRGSVEGGVKLYLLQRLRSSTAGRVWSECMFICLLYPSFAQPCQYCGTCTIVCTREKQPRAFYSRFVWFSISCGKHFPTIPSMLAIIYGKPKSVTYARSVAYGSVLVNFGENRPRALDTLEDQAHLHTHERRPCLK